MHEVGKFLSNTHHMWDGFWLLANRRFFEAMPASTRDVMKKVVNETALKQRADVEKLNADLEAQLVAKGLQFVDVNRELFRQRLQQSGFYAEWKKRLGEEAWTLLESTTGKLA
jgi:TRAP-type transport system periplasmic protein